MHFLVPEAPAPLPWILRNSPELWPPKRRQYRVEAIPVAQSAVVWREAKIWRAFWFCVLITH